MENITITINTDRELYVISGEKYTSCYGFDICLNLVRKIQDEFNLQDADILQRGTIEVYNKYISLCSYLRDNNLRSTSELYKPFIGNERRKVEIIYKDGSKTRGKIGKSTGCLPVHILLKRVDSKGGECIMADYIDSFRFIS